MDKVLTPEVKCGHSQELSAIITILFGQLQAHIKLKIKMNFKLYGQFSIMKILLLAKEHCKPFIDTIKEYTHWVMLKKFH